LQGAASLASVPRGYVIPAKAGIQRRHCPALVILDTGVRRYDEEAA
jgi:hypothetical protein